MGHLLGHLAISLKTLALSYLAVPVFFLVMSLFFYPDLPCGLQTREAKDDPNDLSIVSPVNHGEIKRVYRYVRDRIEFRSSQLIERDIPDIYNSSFHKQIKTLPFWAVAIVTAFFVLRLNYYIAIVERELHTFTNDASKAESFNEIFNYLLPVTGLISIPIVGFVLTKIGFSGTYLVIAVNKLNFTNLSLNKVSSYRF